VLLHREREDEMSETDPSLMQDFLTEASELIEQLDADLVKLETADEASQADMLNSCFRALHTIKGAAGFLGLTNVINFAHVAEDALNHLRKGEVQVTPEVMDALLGSADTVRSQIEAIGEGDEAPEADEALIQTLKAIIEGKADAGAASDEGGDASAQANEGQDDLPGIALDLPPQKQDLLEFMVTDLMDYSRQLDEAIPGLGSDATRTDAAEHLKEIADNLLKTADFFELDDLTHVIQWLEKIGENIDAVASDQMTELTVRIQAIRVLIDEQAHALEQQRALSWPVESLESNLSLLLGGDRIADELAAKHEGDPEKLLVIEGIRAGDSAEPTLKLTDGAKAEEATSDQTAETPSAGKSVEVKPEAASTTQATKSAPAKENKGPVAEQTIRVEVGRLEELLNLVGQLVLSKNRILGVARRFKDETIESCPELNESFGMASGELDRLTGELQVSVMRTRMQPLAKLFDRYPRVIRDIARSTEKKIDLEIKGKETEVDKSVLESLADPLVHILRNSADHGVEAPADRLATGKPESGKITLTAEHQGSHVRVAIQDDGKGLDREVIGNKAIEKGLTTADQLSQMDDAAVFRFIFEAGFSTAAQVSDLSGRGVGMDVVRTNINKINGTIHIDSVKGKGTTIEILIPLTVAIMPAMVVGVGAHLYAIPLQSIVEIVKPENLHTMNGNPVMRLRDQVLPLIPMTQRLNETLRDDADKFAVIVGVGNQRAGLLVNRLVGQQEVVIKPLDDGYTQGGPFSGATIQEDGEVSLILDVTQLIRQPAAGQASPRLAA